MRRCTRPLLRCECIAVDARHINQDLSSATDTTFNFICQNTASKCILAHVRAASGPPIVETNNHPFIFGRHSFMHNGGVTFFPQIVGGPLPFDKCTTLISTYAAPWYSATHETRDCLAVAGKHRL